MPVQRKVFRIEEGAGLASRARAHATQAVDAEPRNELIAEIRALRAMIEPRATPDRDAMERARSQIVAAQSYKHELDMIYAAVKRTRQEIDTIGTGSAAKAGVSRAGEELQAIVKSTEQATQSVLQHAEDIDQVATTLSAVLKGTHDQGLVHDIHERVIQIYEACNFQDLTGQRVAKVAATLRFIEDHIGRLMEIWHGIERFEPVEFHGDDPDRKLLNGPKLGDDAGHFSQHDIDTMFVK
jgi:chemotaxis protein CheZ